MKNVSVADIFRRIALYLRFEEENPFRIRAYLKAADTIESLGQPLEELHAKGEDLTQLAGIGDDLAGKIEVILRTNTHPLLQNLEKKYPSTLIDLLNFPQLGPKKVKKLYQELKIKDLKDLEQAAKKNLLVGLEGFGNKTQASILETVSKIKKEGEVRRFQWNDVKLVASALIDHLKRHPEVLRVEIAGSFRRHKESVGDLDLIVSCKNSQENSQAVMDHFIRYPEVENVLSHGMTRSTVVLKSRIQVDLRTVPEKSYGAALVYFTGSKEHNIQLRRRALDLGYKVNEYGVWRGKRQVAGREEIDVYRALNLPYIVPELREGQGEIEAAEQGLLPHVIELADIKGDLHSHTVASDGLNTLKEMALAAKKLGRKYLAITEHSQKVKVANGLTPDRLLRHIEAIDRLNEELKGIKLLKGIEVDILEDGSLDLPDDVLKRLDVRVCSVHYHQKMPGEQMTKRILKAMDNPYFNILGHPTGRLIGSRRAYEVAMERILSAAKERQCFVEVNSQPKRLDLHDIYCKMAKDMNVMVAISSDAHSIQDLTNLELGIFQARRGWLAAADVINTRSWPELRKLLKR